MNEPKLPKVGSWLDLSNDYVRVSALTSSGVIGRDNNIDSSWGKTSQGNPLGSTIIDINTICVVTFSRPVVDPVTVNIRQ